MDGGPDDPPAPSALRRALVLPVTLAVVAGYVDAVGFLHLFGVFPANQSGNVVLFGIAVGGTSPSPAWATAAAILAFAAGAAAGRVVAVRRAPVSARVPLLAVELGLLVVVAAAAALGWDDGTALLPDPWRPAVLVVAGLAMGVQTEVVRHSAGVAVATTYQTGAVARIGEAIGTAPGSPERSAAQRTQVVLGAVLVGYVTGAALGASPLGDGRRGLLPALVVVAVTLAAAARSADGARHDGAAPAGPADVA